MFSLFLLVFSRVKLTSFKQNLKGLENGGGGGFEENFWVEIEQERFEENLS